ncbi:MAG TPA: helix-turn-helix domain-containing protein, partial [Arenibaculum sp.]|nr:helix-turn-helix domain-containing protein [Arenibaculum sp.]
MSKPLTVTTHDVPEVPGTRRRSAARPKAPRATRDPEGTRARIMRAARDEFAANGLAGARIDRIADMAGTNKRMLYYHVGNKEDLFLAVLEEAYADIRAAERELSLETLEPPDAIARLIA